MKEFTQQEKNTIDDMKEMIKEKLKYHLEDGMDFYIEAYRQPNYWLGIKYDQKRITYLLLEALKLATIELQAEWASATA